MTNVTKHVDSPNELCIIKSIGMKKNLSGYDRIARVMTFVLTLALYFSGSVTGAWGIGLMIIGFVLAVTALISWCPIYHLFGISTCKRKEVKH